MLSQIIQETEKAINVANAQAPDGYTFSDDKRERIIKSVFQKHGFEIGGDWARTINHLLEETGSA